jgi:predicted secreted Zn-dependent protease
LKSLIVTKFISGLALKAILVTALSFSASLNSHAQKPKAAELDLIEWNETRPLEWKDYPFRRVRKVGYVAITSVKHSVKGYIRNGLPEFDIKVYFDTKESWTGDTTDVKLLSHERLHFDIGEIYRRKIEARIIELQSKGEKRAGVYRAEIKNILIQFNKFSNQYDEESGNGRKKEEQLRWEGIVSAELKRLHK